MSAMRRRRSRRNDVRVAVTDLVDRATLQAIQDRFADRHGRIPTAILDKRANPITFERNHSKYCQVIRDSPEGFDRCRKSDQEIINNVYAAGTARWGVCPHGCLLDFAAPIRVAGDIRAYFFIGQVRGKCGDLDTREFRGASCGFHPCGAAGVQERGSPHLPDLAPLFRRIRLFSESEVRALEADAIAFADDLSWVLSKLYEWRKPREIRQFVAEMVHCADMDALLALCVKKIPKLMGSRHCSVLTVESGGSPGSERLVLRRTTFEPSRKWEGSAYYLRGQGLTGWVWANKRALRLRDIGDDAEIAKYQGLTCSHTVKDTHHLGEWLGVPLIGSQGDVIGVIRVPEKARAGGGFDFTDEVLLLSIGSAVAGQIEHLRTRGIAQRAIQVCSDCAEKLGQADDVDRVTRIILQSCRDVWGTKGKSFFFNRLDPKENVLKIADVLGGLGRKRLRGRPVSLDDSLSGRCLRLRRSVIIHDFAREPLERKELPELLGGMECGMSVPVEVQGRTIGTLSVGGDSRYEFSREPDLRILERLGRLAGAALTRLQAQQDAQRAFAHNCVHVGHVLGNHLASVDARISTLNMRRLDSDVTALRETLGKMSGVVKRLKSFADAWVPARARVFELRTVFAELRRTYTDPRLAWRLRGRIPMLGTPALLGQALVELIENALRYAPDEDGEIAVSAFQRGAGLKPGSRNRYVVVEVRDNGPGVPEGLKEAIFEPFTKHESGHLGLGLYIVRLVVEAHGGTISECGRKGRGARFRARFPQ